MTRTELRPSKRASADTTTRKATTAMVLAVGLFAGSDSYSHIYSLARGHGQDVISAALLPLAGDGLIAAASSVMLVAARQQRDIPLKARVMLLAGIAATIAANMAYGLAGGRTDALLSVWPVAAYVGCMELLTWMRQNTQPKRRASGAAPADASVDAPDDLKVRREHKARTPAHDLLVTAEKTFPGQPRARFPRSGKSSRRCPWASRRRSSCRDFSGNRLG